ncbi:cupin domain-containing protein [Aquicella lusitana]|uniref:Cupin n=1 Tax=Aquicella lusitana TaxID=254246 RepID=A0A370GAE1_9COXI|nr:hypothetical protein [Aquicella lusitana]RDI40170.1 hypothetical protein C8D86_1234 [Aquicella lusitana]VVC72439.1 hypothetical protein AQULUS_01510 [Aquicella lusitana]
MEGTYQREIIVQQPDFIIVKLTLEKDAVLPTHKSRGLTTIIPVKGEGILTRNAEAIAIRPGVSVELTPHDEHDLLAKTVLELIVVEVFLK